MSNTFLPQLEPLSVSSKASTLSLPRTNVLRSVNHRQCHFNSFRTLEVVWIILMHAKFMFHQQERHVEAAESCRRSSVYMVGICCTGEKS